MSALAQNLATLDRLNVARNGQGLTVKEAVQPYEEIVQVDERQVIEALAGSWGRA